MIIQQAKNASAVQNVLPLIEAYWQFEKIDHFEPNRVATLLQHLLDHPEHGSLWLAANEDRCLGYLLLTYQFSLEYGGMGAEIDEFFVMPSARSFGVGKALLQAAEKHLRDHYFVKFQLQIANENAAARAFYRQQGFTERTHFQLMDKTI